MKVANTSDYSTAAVTQILVWAAREMEVGGYVTEVRVTNTRNSYRGRCTGRRVLIRLGSPDKFPILGMGYGDRRLGDHRLKTAPTYDVADWRECLVALAGHEFQHSRQFMAKAPRHSEVEAERSAVWLLGRYRNDPSVEDTLSAAIVRAEENFRVRAAAKRETAAARVAAARLPERRVEVAKAKIAIWERKRKTAETYLKKYRRRLRAAERAIAKRAAGEESVSTRGGQQP